MAVKTGPPIDGGTVLVTGASAGIGREFAVQLARRCETLVLLARRAELLDKLRDDLAARHPRLAVVALPADLSDESDVARVVAQVRDRVGAVDVLVNNAGVGYWRPVLPRGLEPHPTGPAHQRGRCRTTDGRLGALDGGAWPRRRTHHGVGGGAVGDARRRRVLGQQAFR